MHKAALFLMFIVQAIAFTPLPLRTALHNKTPYARRPLVTLPRPVSDHASIWKSMADIDIPSTAATAVIFALISILSDMACKQIEIWMQSSKKK